MKLTMLKVVVLGLVTVGSLTVLVNQCWPGSHGSPGPSVSETREQVIPVVLSLRLAAKGQIARDVIAGRLSLVQAAALFGALNRVSPQSLNPSLLDMQVSHLPVRARTDDERVCRQVVECVACELAEEPDRLDAAVARLEAEFKEEVRKSGAICLPSPSSLTPVSKLLEHARAELTEKGVLAQKG